ncbi:hypothetical protein GCM10011430_28250 [Oxalicibacterium solurbis]|uniref:Arsenical-resistance protein n=1 Tax=Oxalicibacterium solurbis TaxID=69280 RepID=A0A8J3F7R5_9BURK|nr:hypothetical protein GCM10011430_28250 [Oxalicibacterium solurbis]
MTASQAAVAKEAAPSIGFFERYLTVWVALCIVVIGIGQVFPSVVRVVGGMEIAQVNLAVGVLIWVMIIPTAHQAPCSGKFAMRIDGNFQMRPVAGLLCDQMARLRCESMEVLMRIFTLERTVEISAKISMPDKASIEKLGKLSKFPNFDD